MNHRLFWVIAVMLSAAVYYLFDWAVGLRQYPAPLIVAKPPHTPEKTAPLIKAQQAPTDTKTVAAPPQPLPAPGQRDAMVADALEKLLGRDVVADLLHPDKLVQRIVATIDNLPRGTVAARLRPFKAAEGSYAIAESPDGIVASPTNAARYARYHIGRAPWSERV